MKWVPGTRHFRARKLGLILMKVSGNAGDNSGSALLDDLISIARRPGTGGLTGNYELSMLRRSPGDREMAQAAADAILDRARADSAFSAAFTAWCRKEHPQDLIATRRSAAPSGPRSGGLRPAMSQPDRRSGHVFISYVRDDAARVDRLQDKLASRGLRVWRDTADLWPGEDWKAKIRAAITDNALVFICCFSLNSASRATTYQNEELALAIEELRRRQPGKPWLFPVRLDDCDIPDLDVGGGQTLGSFQRADLFGDRYDQDASRLVESIRRILEAGRLVKSDRRILGQPSAGRTWALAASGTLAAVAAVAFVVIRALFGPGGTPSGPGSPAAHTSYLYSGTAYDFDFPSAIAAAGGRAWVANYGNNAVAELNASNDSLVPDPSAPYFGSNGADAIAMGGGHVWVANSLDRSVAELNASNGSLVQVLSAAKYGFGEPDGIAVYGGDVWIAGFGNLVTELNASNASLIKELSAASYGVDGQDSIAADSRHVWVANEEADTVTELDASDGQVVQSLHAPRYGFADPNAIAVDGTHVWVSNRSGNSVTELNERDGSLVKVLPAATYGFAGPNAIAADGTHVWVADGDSNSMTELNESDGSFVQTFSSAVYGFSDPTAIAVDGSRVWVANEYGNSVTELPA
jgi:DNA-binding beta-propeller fold protein YncE